MDVTDEMIQKAEASGDYEWAAALRDMKMPTAEKNANIMVVRRNQQRQNLLMQLYMGRQQAGLTQAQLAAKADMKQPSLARIETGKVSPSLQTLIRLAQGLDMEITLQPSRPQSVKIDKT